MNNYKSILASRTVWSGILTLLAVLAGAFGYTITDGDQTEIVEAVSTLVATLGAIGTVLFRVKATKQLGK